MRSLPQLVAALMLLLCLPAARAEGPRWERVFSALEFERPVLLTPLPGEADAVVVVEQAGKVSWFPNRPDVSPEEQTVALDISGEKVLRRGNEEGLLGLAFHPDFPQTPHVFLHYSAPEPRRNVLSRWRWEDGRIAPDSEEVVLEVEQPYSNHNGGHLLFGPDGYLYVALGDGGSGGDPHNNGQRLDTLLGKLLRIDVTEPQNGKPYSVPADNPFVDRDGARPEIWAYGLRNLWRFSFDPETGELWGGDVGQNMFEEIDIIVKGGNYGWNVREGFAAFKGGPLATKPADMIDPVIHYPRSQGMSVTGGHVYRGEKVPSLRGAYIYGDHVTGHVWALRRVEGDAPQNTKIGQVMMVTSFGLDRSGEFYACSLMGPIFKLVP